MANTDLIVLDGLTGTRKELGHIRSWLRDIADGGLAHLIGPHNGIVYWGNQLQVIVAPRVDQRRICELADAGYLAEENYAFHPSLEGDPKQRVTTIPFHLTSKGRTLLRQLSQL